MRIAFRDFGKRSLDRIDDLFAGRWFWQALRSNRERRLEKDLLKYGDKSMEARIATERVRRIQFAVEYGRAAPGPVMQIAREATARGISRNDVKLMVLNRDLRLQGSRAEVRSSAFVQAVCRTLSGAFNAVLAIHFVLMCALVVLEHGPLWLKAIVLFATTLIYSVFYRGWALYTSRALRALSRSGRAVEAISNECFQDTIEATAIAKKRG
ncbi:MAG: hypothetical protein JSS28_05905 [Proteobacteria bacterium]|nr:hypothetical protein [Pseudomonadota bacterium]